MSNRVPIALLAVPDFTAVNDDIAAILATIATIQSQIATLQGQVATLQSQVATIQGQITTIQGQIATIQSQITTIQGQISTIQGQIASIQAQIVSIQSDIITIQGQIAALAELEVVDALFTIADPFWGPPQWNVAPPTPANADSFTMRAVRQGGIVQIYTNPAIPGNISNYMRSPLQFQQADAMQMTHNLPAAFFPRDGSITIPMVPMRWYRDNLILNGTTVAALTIRDDGTAVISFDQEFSSSVGPGTTQNVGYMPLGFGGSYSVDFVLP